MDKKLYKKFQKKLEKEKKRLTKQLASFAKRDSRIKGNWLTRFPFLGFATRSHKDEDAEEREEYENRLAVEQSLEVRLKDINNALKKIEKGTYGICENCKKPIEQKRLEAVPEAKICLTCGRSPARH